MVLRLFSKSSSKDAKANNAAAGSQPARADAPAAQLPKDATPDEIEQAIRDASSARDRAELIDRLQDVDALKRLAATPQCLALCADRMAALDSIAGALALATTPATRAELAIHAHNAELRAAQIAALTTEQELVELEHASRSKNKACNRAARERLDELRHARSEATTAADLAAELADHARKLDADAHLQARFAATAQKYQSAADQHAASSAVLHAFGETAPALEPMPPAPEVQAPAAEDEGPDFTALSQVFTALAEQLRTGTTAADIASAIAKAGQDWRAAITEATPSAAAIDEVAAAATLFEKVSASEALLTERTQAINELLAESPTITAQEVAQLPKEAGEQTADVWQQRDQAQRQNKLIGDLLTGLEFPGGVPLPPVLTQLQDRKTELGALLGACKDRQTKLEEAFKDQVKRLGQALDAGELKRAEAARGQARVLQDALPGGAANASRKRYGALIASMQNLRDWQHFATDPKREELCEKMTTLADAPKTPDEQADRVKDLRAQWNALGGKGPKELAARFDAAAARAFEPCREHYAQLAGNRAKNLATRQGILEALETFVTNTDWAHADLAGARTILNSARNEWRDAFPVERGPNRGLEKRFKTVTDALYEHLQEGWSGNLAAKEALVSQAEALLDSTDPLPQRLDQAKRLQQQWKETGPVPRGPDQKLWKRLRSACDALFSARDEERTQAKAEFEAQRSAANALLDTFEQTLEATTAADLERSLLTKLKTDFDAIDQLDRGVTKRARDLEDRFTAKIKEKAAAQKQATLGDLERLDEQAATSELAKQPIAEEVLAANKVFAERTAGAATAHLDLVLEAESQAGIDSPAEDAQRRLELQVEWLNAGMNSGARKSADGMELAQRWCALHSTERSNNLRARLFAAASKLLG